jgi:putative transposase
MPVLMDNHVHILFKSGKHGISAVMRKLLTWYAQYYNRRHKRSGNLFENRYKSILCDEDNYLLALVRYIHLNPLRADIVKTIEELDRYSFVVTEASSVRPIIRGWIPITCFCSLEIRDEKALQSMRFMREGVGLGHQPELTGGGLIRSLGGWSQVIARRRSEKRKKGMNGYWGR